MKTNHQRQYVQKRNTDPRQKAPSFYANDRTTGVTSKYCGNDFTDGKHGAAHAIGGAKKFVRTRTRRKLNRLVDIEC